MIKILKKNILYILIIGLLWLIFFPIVILNKDSIYDWYVLKVSPRGYTPKTMKKFISSGDKALNNGLEDSIEIERLKDQLDNPKKKEELLLFHLAKMEEACEFSEASQKKDDLLIEPSWLERNSNWSSDKEESSNGVGTNRKALPSFSSPENYWKKNVPPLLEALDYYKRALYYSGPEILAADKIHFISKSICRKNESIIAYSTYLNHSNAYVNEIIQSEDDEYSKKSQSFLNKIKRFFGQGYSTDRSESYGLTPLQRKTTVWSYIKENHAFPVLFDYLKGMNILLLDTNLRNMSPIEADELYETMLFFLAKTDDPIQQKNERFFRFKRGIHLYKMEEYAKAKEQFKAAKEFSDLKDESPVSIRLIMAHIFQSELMIAKSDFKLGNYKEAMISINTLENSLHSVDGRDGGKMDIDLLKDYKKTKIEILKKLGRIKEAEEMEE